MPEDPEDDDPPEEEDDGSDDEESAEEDDETSDEQEESSGEDDETSDQEEESPEEDAEESTDEDESEEESDGEGAEDETADDASDDETSDDTSDDEAAAAGDDDGETVLPALDDDVFGSREEWGGDDEDFEDDQGDWSADDYHEVATTLFGDHEFFGDTAEQRYIDEGFTPIEEDDHEIVRGVRERLVDASTVRFFERDGQIVPRGFLTSTALELLEAAFPALDLAFLHITVPKRPRPVPGDGAPPRRGLPPELAMVAPRDSVDLRKYATPVGDQGTTSRCAAFAWTHALEMLANMNARPFPRLACSFTMVRFQQLQGDFKDFRYAWKGGDGTSGTWEPGAHLFVNGTCRHDHWPNDKKEPLVSLDQMEADARNHTFEADVYDVTLDEMKTLLSAGLPVQISMATGDGFQEIGRDGLMKIAEAPKGQHGYHAMLCVGYVGNYFIVKNSWGEDWGDNGYCYIPKKMLAESEPEAVAIVPRNRMAPPAPNAPPGGGQAPRPSFSASGAAQRTQAIPMIPSPPSIARAQQASASSVVCPKCTKQVPLGRFCSECGSALPPPPTQRNFCSSCGARRLGAGRFCASCGAKHE